MRFLKAIFLLLPAACLLMQSGCTDSETEARPPGEFAPAVEDPNFSSITGGPAIPPGEKAEK
ncbi:hypothetical protein N9Y42_01130 [Mariniblastus sp.]|nr:hypothetical protein [Mariniblastus sp.]